MIEIFEIAHISEEICRAFERLVPQLTSAPIPGQEQLERIVRSEASSILAARDSQSREIIGLLALAVFEVPTGVHAWIEDVVVDEKQRGRGAGEALTLTAVDLARQRGATSISLTSNPTREAANRLYLRLGFKPWHTNLYRLILKN
jgi:ribosomal protein S18 acetylase RimI-like enzyme